MTDNNFLAIPIWPYAYGEPCGTGKIRVIPDDFIVSENLSFQPSGNGEHVFLQMTKTGENTDYLARQLARFAGVRQRDIGYAGLKDRNAVTTQWFSVWLPGKADPDWRLLDSASVKVNQAIRHDRKLKRGVLAGNRFEITIRDYQGDRDDTLSRLAQIKKEGVPNYYGEQRFGHQGRNVENALALFNGMKVAREQRSLYFSAARSFLFNQILAERVRQQNWNQAIPGDVVIFNRSNSWFKAEFPDADIVRRLDEKILHPAGTLWGKGESQTADAAKDVERQVIELFPELAQGLIASSVEQSVRPMRLVVAELDWQFKDSNDLLLSFNLPAGSYATAVLREIVDYGGA